MRTVLRRVATFLREDPGQDLIEYSLLIALLAMAAAGILSQVGGTAQGPWSTASTTLAGAGGTTPTITASPGGHGDHGGDGGR